MIKWLIFPAWNWVSSTKRNSTCSGPPRIKRDFLGKGNSRRMKIDEIKSVNSEGKRKLKRKSFEELWVAKEFRVHVLGHQDPPLEQGTDTIRSALYKDWLQQCHRRMKMLFKSTHVHNNLQKLNILWLFITMIISLPNVL